VERESDSPQEGPRADLEVAAGYSARRIRRRADARVRTETAGDVEWVEEETESEPGSRTAQRWRLRAWLERPHRPEAEG